MKETLDLLGLNGYEERITYRLSGGEKRLISIATVLAMKPDVLLLDEPTTALDEEAIQRVIKTLNDLASTMIIVSQDRNFLAEIAQQSHDLSTVQLIKGRSGLQCQEPLRTV